MGRNAKKIHSEVLMHPGDVLAGELEARGIVQKSFAALVDMRPSHFNELLKGKRHMSAQVALRLEKQLKIEAGFWMRLQIDYDLKMARKQLEVA